VKRALVLMMLLVSARAWAHKPSDAHLRLAVDGALVSGRLDVAIRDLDGALGLDADGNGQITWGEAQAATPQITAYLLSRLAIETERGQACPILLGTAALADLSDGAYWAVPVHASCPSAPHELSVTYRLLFDVDSLHRGLLHVEGQTAIARDATPLRFALGEHGSVLAMFVREGVWHIWLGIDHILFLLCLILPAVFPRKGGRWQPAESLRHVSREVLAIVTAFTLAHSITLVISAVGLIRLPSRYVETAIALSVVAAAVNNLLRAIDARWAVAFALGLLHGFGFSSGLIDLGLPSGELVGPLLGFNVGVELGQGLIVVALLPLFYAIRRTLAYQALLWAGSGAVAVIATLWSYQRWMA
jgi:HupE/UreJ protein